MLLLNRFGYFGLWGGGSRVQGRRSRVCPCGHMSSNSVRESHHNTPQTIQPTPHAMNPQSSIINPLPRTPNRELHTPNYNLHSNPQTLKLTSSTLLQVHAPPAEGAAPIRAPKVLREACPNPKPLDPTSPQNLNPNIKPLDRTQPQVPQS